MVDTGNVTPNIEGLIRKLVALVNNLSDIEFEYGSSVLDEKVSAALTECKFVAQSGFSQEQIIKRCQNEVNWANQTARWRLVLDLVVSYLDVKATAGELKAEGNNEEELEEEEVEIVDDVENSEEEEEEEDGGTSGIVNKIADEFSIKEELDEFLLKKLPEIPIIGLPFKFLSMIFNFLKKCWNGFLDIIDKIVAILDTENNILAGIRLVSRTWKPLSWLVVFFSTILAYGNWLWFGLIWPFLRWLTDPIGRSLRFFRKRAGKSDEQDVDDSEEIEEN